MDRVVWESRHKFVYYDDESIEILRRIGDEYIPTIDSDEPIVIYEIDEGLPRLDTNLKLDDYRLSFFHERYYELLIMLSILNKLSNHIDYNELNTRLKRVFELFSYMYNSEINDVNELRTLLVDSKNMYREGYIKYMETGKVDFYDKVPIKFVILDDMIPSLKRSVGFKKYFCFMFEFEGDIDKYACRAINGHIASRCNGYLSMNVLLSDRSEWKSYFANNGQFIEYTHDYGEVDLRKSKTRSRNIQN